MSGLLLSVLLAAEASQPTAASSASLTIKVTNKDAAADALAAKAEALGGYFSSRSEQGLVLRVPNGSDTELVTFAGTLGVVVERTLQKDDLSESLEQARSQLRSREETLKRYMDVLREAGPGQVVMVERGIVAQIQDIERLKGRVRAMEHRLRYATLTVSFQFKERRAPLESGFSSFAWINTVNLSDLIEEFRHEN